MCQIQSDPAFCYINGIDVRGCKDTVPLQVSGVNAIGKESRSKSRGESVLQLSTVYFSAALWNWKQVRMVIYKARDD